MTRLRSAAPALLILAASAGLVQPAHAAITTRVVRVSSTPHLPASCLTAADGLPSADVEPDIAVNPRDPLNMIATWWIGQDNFHALAKAGGLAYTTDGGRTWHAGIIPGVDACSGGPTDRTDGAHDTWVSFGSDGVAYLATEAFSSSVSHMLSLVSRDGGQSWGPPVEIAQAPRFTIDKPVITGDPARPGVAYHCYLSDFATDPAGFTVMSDSVRFSRTVDGGHTWSSPRIIYTSPTGWDVNTSFLVATRSGTLIEFMNAFHETSAPPGADAPTILVEETHSTDGGRTWSAARTVASYGAAIRLLQPGGSNFAATRGIVSVATDGRQIYIALSNAKDAAMYAGLPLSHVVLMSSGDDGRTWSHPIAVDNDGMALEPGVAVAGDGTVGVSYYDFSQDSPTDSVWTMRRVLSISHDHGLSWTQHQVGPTFDLAQAPQYPDTQGPAAYLGDYFEMAGTPHGFAAAFVAAKPMSTEGRSDVFVAVTDLR